MNDRCPVCGKKTSEGKNGGKICFDCVNRKRGLMNNPVNEIPDKEKFFLDMLNAPMNDNRKIGEVLKEQAEYLTELSNIAFDIYWIKEHANEEICKTGNRYEISMDINKMSRIYKNIVMFKEEG